MEELSEKADTDLMLTKVVEATSHLSDMPETIADMESALSMALVTGQAGILKQLSIISCADQAAALEVTMSFFKGCESSKNRVFATLRKKWRR